MLCFARHFFCAATWHRGFHGRGANPMNHKKFFAAALMVTMLFIPHVASAAEQNMDAEMLARNVVVANTRPNRDEIISALEITRSNDLPQRPAALPTMAPFQDMWALILKYRHKHASHFSPELIACLFWEESAFRMVEHPLSGAVGYGQVLPSTLRAVNKRFGTNFTPNDLLTSRDASVEASVLALELAWEWKRDKANALAAYAGGAPNQHVVRKWLAAEAAMQKGRIPFGNSFGVQEYVEHHQIRALRMVSQPGFDPQVIFD